MVLSNSGAVHIISKVINYNQEHCEKTTLQCPEGIKVNSVHQADTLREVLGEGSLP